MAQLIAFIVSGIGSLLALLLSMFGRKVIVATAAVAAALALTVALALVINTLLTAVVAALSLPAVFSAIYWFVPTDFSVCIAAIISANIARAAYDLGMEKIRLIATSS